MLRFEYAAQQAFDNLSDDEKGLYAAANEGTLFVDVAAKAINPTTPRAKKKIFNNSVHSHFANGRRLSDAHKKAISDGLKRWHAAHGRGTYTKGQRNSAVRHLNKRFQGLADHHQAMHAVHKQRMVKAKKTGNFPLQDIHEERMNNSLKRHKLFKSLIRHLGPTGT